MLRGTWKGLESEKWTSFVVSTCFFKKKPTSSTLSSNGEPMVRRACFHLPPPLADIFQLVASEHDSQQAAGQGGRFASLTSNRFVCRNKTIIRFSTIACYSVNLDTFEIGHGILDCSLTITNCTWNYAEYRSLWVDRLCLHVLLTGALSWSSLRQW